MVSNTVKLLSVPSSKRRHPNFNSTISGFALFHAVRMSAFCFSSGWAVIGPHSDYHASDSAIAALVPYPTRALHSRHHWFGLANATVVFLGNFLELSRWLLLLHICIPGGDAFLFEGPVEIVEGHPWRLTAHFLNPKELLEVAVFFDGKLVEPEVMCRIEDVQCKVRRGLSIASYLEDFGPNTLLGAIGRGVMKRLISR